jgi:hypothetical protein
MRRGRSQLLLAIMTMLTVPFGASGQSLTGQELDLQCAVETRFELSLSLQTGKDLDHHWEIAASFFAGRLSVRDENANWNEIILQKIKDGFAQHNAPILPKCYEIYSRTIH